MARYSQYDTWFRLRELLDEEFDRRLGKVYKAILLYVMGLDDYLRQCKLGPLLIFIHLNLHVPSNNTDYFSTQGVHSRSLMNDLFAKQRKRSM